MGAHSDLDELTAPAVGDYVVAVDVSEGLNRDKLLSLSKLGVSNLAQTWAALHTYGAGIRIGDSTNHLIAERSGVTISNSGFTTAKSAMVGTSIAWFQANNNATNVGAFLWIINNGGTLAITPMTANSVVSGVPTGFQVGYQASGTDLQLRAGPSWPATIGINLFVARLTW